MGLLGLVLAGGKSRRMQREKYRIEVQGKTLISWQKKWLEPLVEDVYFSFANTGHSFKEENLIFDLILDSGPLIGIYSALERFPKRSFLVLPVDIFLFDPEILEEILIERAESKSGTIFLNQNRKKPEPLMGIYESSALPILRSYLAGGGLSATNFVLENDFKLIPKTPSWINLNGPKDLEALQDRLGEK
jgi:molybdopterin-guanine dinucleotide biosynthesis protein A